MRISKIILDNFRGYEHEEIAFNRFNCIVGKNDVGKSTIFEAIKWFFDKSQNDADNEFNINQLVHDFDEPMDYYDDDGNFVDAFEGGYTSEIVGGETMSVELRFCEVNDINANIKKIFTEKNAYRDKRLIIDTIDFLNESGELCIKKVIQHSYTKSLLYDEIEVTPIYLILTKQYQKQLPISLWNMTTLIKKYAFIYGDDDDLLRTLIKISGKNVIEIYYSDYTKKIITQLRYYYSEYYKYKLEWLPFDRSKTDYLRIIPKFRYFNADSFGFEYANVIQDYINSIAQCQISLSEIQNSITKEFKTISDVFNKTITTINSKLKLVPKVTCKFNVQFEFTNGLDSIALKNRGEGIQRVLMNIVFRYLANKDTGKESIFVFEEPETHLHPEAQKDFFKTLIKLSERYNQVFITTHSPLMVSMCDVKDIIHIKNENDYPKVYQNDNTSLQEVIEDLGIGPNDTMLSIFDEYKSILFVEGKNDVKALNKISELYKNKKKGEIEQTFEEMKCLIIPFGGCSTVEEWANLGIVTKLAKPFAVLLDSDKKTEEHESKNQKKLDSVFTSLNSSSDESKKIKMKLCKQNFMLTRKREMENYIKPNAIEKFFNDQCENPLHECKKKDVDAIYETMKNEDCVDYSMVTFVYKNEYDRIVKPKIEELPERERKGSEDKIRKENPIDREKLINKINDYVTSYNETKPISMDFREWVYCKEKGIEIKDYGKYESCIGKRMFIYCRENNIDLDAYIELYNKCTWVRGDNEYLIAYIKNKKKINADILQYDSKEKFENALDEKSKKKIAQRNQIEQDILVSTIPDNVSRFSFCDDEKILKSWNNIDVPLAVYCCQEHKRYDEKYSDNSSCKNKKVYINKHFFEEGNIKFEDLDFSYGDNQDEFLDIYNKIKALCK